jgi:hypothetical protein
MIFKSQIKIDSGREQEDILSLLIPIKNPQKRYMRQMSKIKCHECKKEMESKNDSIVQYCEECKKKIGGIILKGDDKIHLDRSWLQRFE